MTISSSRLVSRTFLAGREKHPGGLRQRRQPQLRVGARTRDLERPLDLVAREAALAGYLDRREHDPDGDGHVVVDATLFEAREQLSARSTASSQAPATKSSITTSASSQSEYAVWPRRRAWASPSRRWRVAFSRSPYSPSSEAVLT